MHTIEGLNVSVRCSEVSITCRGLSFPFLAAPMTQAGLAIRFSRVGLRTFNILLASVRPSYNPKGSSERGGPSLLQAARPWPAVAELGSSCDAALVFSSRAAQL
jgi:hypothetical protein